MSENYLWHIFGSDESKNFAWKFSHSEAASMNSKPLREMKPHEHPRSPSLSFSKLTREFRYLPHFPCGISEALSFCNQWLSVAFPLFSRTSTNISVTFAHFLSLSFSITFSHFQPLSVTLTQAETQESIDQKVEENDT